MSTPSIFSAKMYINFCHFGLSNRSLESLHYLHQAHFLACRESPSEMVESDGKPSESVSNRRRSNRHMFSGETKEKFGHLA